MKMSQVTEISTNVRTNQLRLIVMQPYYFETACKEQSVVTLLDISGLGHTVEQPIEF